MTGYPKTGNAAPAFRELEQIADEAAALQARARAILDGGLRQEIIGRRVRRFGRVYQIVAVDVRVNARATCCGATVSKTGKVGRRGFDLGLLDQCEFLP